MTISGSWLPNIPLYGGGALNQDVPSLYPVALGGHGYLIDTVRYRRRTIQALRSAQDTGQTPAEQSLNIEGSWPRFQTDWSLGAGEVEFDDTTAQHQHRRRFLESSGVNIWNRRELSLLNQMREIRSSANTNLRLLTAGTYLYVVDGNGVVFTANPEVASPTWTTMTGLAGTMQDITTDGSRVFIATTVGVYWASLGATAALIFTTGLTATSPRQRIAFGNGRLIAGSNHVLEEIVGTTGARTELHTHFDTTFRWTALGFSQRAAYAAGLSGTHTDFFRFTNDPTTGALQRDGPAAAFPTGEVVYSVVGYVGVVGIGTSRGLRIADVAADGSLDYRRFLDVGEVRQVVGEGDYLWFTWNHTTLGAGTGRASLADFTDDRVPAYARDVASASTLPPISIARYGEYTYLAAEGDGIFAEFAELVEDGFITTGWIDYGTWFSKNWLTIDMRHAPLAGVISVSLVDGSGTETTYGDSDDQGTDRPTDTISFSQARLERAQLKITLSRFDADSGPTLYHWVLLVSPNPPRYEEFILPIMFHSRVKATDHRQAIDMVLLDEMRHIKLLVEDGQITTFQEGYVGYLVKVKDYELEGYKWSEDPAAYHWIIEGTLMCVLQTQ